jgi:hypothetical protein
MKPVERIALQERIARAIAWHELSTTRRDDFLRRAGGIITELETSDEQLKRIGWLLVDVDEEPEPVE